MARSLFSFGVLIALVAVSSCSTSHDVISDRGIQKRKYRKGFYVARSGSLASPQNLPATESVKSRASMAAAGSTDERFVDSPEGRETVDQDFQQPQVTIRTNAATTKETSSKENTPAPNHVHARPKRSNAFDGSEVHTKVDLATVNQSTDDTELILYILLSVLLPPLAVYLLYGISTNFWISVALTLLIWLPGVIFALIHVINRKG